MEIAGPRLLVTGGAGFVLSNFVQHWLTDDNTATAVIFDQKKAWDQSIQEFLGCFLATGRLSFFDGDVSSSESWILLEQFYGIEFTHVVAGAAVTATREEEAINPSKIIDVNLIGTLKCLEFVRSRLRNIHRCVHISSDAVLGVEGLIHSNAKEPAADPLAVPYMSHYALSKFAGEAAVRRWKELFNMDLVSVRFSDVYGKLDRDTGARNIHNAPYKVCRKVLALENKICSNNKGDNCQPIDQVFLKIKAPSLDSVCWDIIDATSVASGLTALLKSQNKPKRHVYHIALGRTPTILEVVESAFGRKLEQNDIANIEIVADDELTTASKGGIDIATLSENHWLKSHPIDISPMHDEFGWYPEKLEIAMNKYMRHLRDCQEKGLMIA